MKISAALRWMSTLPLVLSPKCCIQIHNSQPPNKQHRLLSRWHSQSLTDRLTFPTRATFNNRMFLLNSHCHNSLGMLLLPWSSLHLSSSRRQHLSLALTGPRQMSERPLLSTVTCNNLVLILPLTLPLQQQQHQNLFSVPTLPLQQQQHQNLFSVPTLPSSSSSTRTCSPYPPTCPWPCPTCGLFPRPGSSTTAV